MTNPNSKLAHPASCIYQASAYVVSALRGITLIFPCTLCLWPMCCQTYMATVRVPCCWLLTNSQPPAILMCARHVTGTCAPLNPSAQQSTDASCLAWNNVEDRLKREKEKTVTENHILHTSFNSFPSCYCLAVDHFLSPFCIPIH